MNTASISTAHGLEDTPNESVLLRSSGENSQLSSQSGSGSSWAPSASASSSQVEPSQTSLAPASQGTTEETAVSAEQNKGQKQAKEENTPAFTIPADVLAKAKAAEAGTPDSFWTHKLYAGPDSAKIRVHYCKSKHTTENVLQRYFLNKPVLGFDIEWKIGATQYSSPKKNVSLIQIATEDRIILSHIGLFPKDSVDDLVAPTLRKIMEDPNVLKCGVAIKADCTRMRKYLGVDVKGIFELSHLHRLVKFSESGEYDLINKRLCSLTEQAECHLGLPIFKGEVRGSDWSEALSMDQILYAASDAYAGYVIFQELERKRRALSPCPPRPYPAEENKPIRLASGVEIASSAAEDAAEDAPRATSAGAPHQDQANELNLECDDSAEAAETPAKSKAKAKKEEKVVEPMVEKASQFALAYRAAYPKTTASPAQIRAWHIWYHNPSLSIDDIAAKLRDPPLQSATVLNYILEALRLEGRGIMGSVAWMVDPLGLEAKEGEVENDGKVKRGLMVEKDRLKVLLEGLRGDQKGAWKWKGLWKMSERK